jgi:hypothetical protein
MKNLLRFAMGAAVAGVLVHRLMSRSSERVANDAADELIADTNMVHSGDAATEQRGPQPQDWRGAQNVLES